MENIHLDLSEHEMDVMLNALEIAIENADEYESGEYEEVLFDVQRKLDEEYELDVDWYFLFYSHGISHLL